MRKIIMVAVVLVLLLGACAVAEDAPVEHETTTETTTEATTQPPETYIGREIAMSDTVTVFEARATWSDAVEIWMRDEITGQKTFLMGTEGVVLGSSYYRVPELRYRVNERFFAYARHIRGHHFLVNSRFFDIEQQRSIEVQSPSCFYLYDCHYQRILLWEVTDERVYKVCGWWIGHISSNHRLYAFEISALESGEPVELQYISEFLPEQWDELLSRNYERF